MTNLKAQLDALINQHRALQQKSRRMNNVLNEGGEGYNPINAELEQLGKLILAKQDEFFLSEWTLEITKERRAKWNATVTSQPNQNYRIQDLEKECGFTMMDLRYAVKLHRAELDK